MALPETFWEPNHFGVRGGVKNAFMSTTVDRDVATVSDEAVAEQKVLSALGFGGGRKELSVEQVDKLAADVDRCAAEMRSLHESVKGIPRLVQALAARANLPLPDGLPPGALAAIGKEGPKGTAAATMSPVPSALSASESAE